MDNKLKQSLKIYFKKYRCLQIVSFIFMLASLLSGLLIIVYMQKMMDMVVLVLSDGSISIQSIVDQSFILAGVIVFYLALMFISQVFFRKLNFTAGFGLSLEMIKNTFNLPSKKLEDIASGDLSNRILNDGQYISSWHGAGKVTIACELIWLVASLFIMARYSLFITFIVILGIVIGIKFSNLIQKKIASLTKDFQTLGAKVNSSLIEFLQGIEEIKSYHANDFFYGKIEDMIINQQLKVANSMSVYYSFYLLVNAFLAYALPALVVILGVILVLKGELTLGSILALYALSQQIQEPIRMITEMSQQKETSQQMEDRNSFLLEESEKKTSDLSQPLEKAHLSIKEFSYDKINDKSKPILEDLRFDFLVDDQLFVMGRSGSGKSTLAKILAGKVKLSEEEGCYIWNEQEVREQEMFSDQSALLASQNPYLFSGSIRENLLFGGSSGSEEIEMALKLSCFDEVVEQYGLDYELEEQGKNLSGGQRQRLAVCRALLRKPSLLILDEPSSALNKSTAMTMIENIRAYYKKLGKSLVILTHDEDLVKNDDKVLYL